MKYAQGQLFGIKKKKKRINRRAVVFCVKVWNELRIIEVCILLFRINLFYSLLMILIANIESKLKGAGIYSFFTLILSEHAQTLIFQAIPNNVAR